MSLGCLNTPSDKFCQTFLPITLLVVTINIVIGAWGNVIASAQSEGPIDTLHKTSPVNSADTPVSPPPPSSPLQVKGTRSAIAGTLVGGGTLIGTLIWRRRRHQALEQQLIMLKGRTANIMTHCDDLLTGHEPTKMLHYQLFTAAGGEKYPELVHQVTEWLRIVRQDLNQAFIVRDNLAQQTPKRLTQHVADWERLYCSLLGNTSELLTLNDDQLRILLDPLQTLPASELNPQLATPLETLRKNLEQTSLTTKFLVINPTDIENDTPSIASYINQVNQQIATLQASIQEAPKQLTSLKQQRQALADQMPCSLGIDATQVLTGIDHSLTLANENLEQTLFLYTLDHCNQATQSMAQVEQMISALNLNHQRQQAIIQILDKGYRPNELEQHQTTVKDCLDQLQGYIEQSDYGAIARQSKILNQLTQTTLSHVETWKTHHHQNQLALDHLRQELIRLRGQYDTQAKPAWNTLRTYPEDNWKMVAASLSNAKRLLDKAEQEDLPQIEALNSLDQQQLSKAEQALKLTQEQLFEAAETELQQLCQQAQKIQSLATNLHDKLLRTEENITYVDQLARPKTLGLLQLQKMDPRLVNAQDRVVQAYHSIKQRNFMTALANHNQANRAILMVFRDKLQTDLNQVTALFKHRHARGANRQDLNQAVKQLPCLADLETLDEATLPQYYQQLEITRNAIDAAEKQVKATIRRNRARQ